MKHPSVTTCLLVSIPVRSPSIFALLPSSLLLMTFFLLSAGTSLASHVLPWLLRTLPIFQPTITLIPATLLNLVSPACQVYHQPTRALLIQLMAQVIPNIPTAAAIAHLLEQLNQRFPVNTAICTTFM